MATIRKTGTTQTPPAANHIGEDKSFGRASQLSKTARKSGLNPHNAKAEDDPVLEHDAISMSKTAQPAGHKGH
ncbi:MAG: hypothetical protein JHC81_02185 [Brevundimonas sp.]|uniref:hypothetical protein n=1 Tax=Brevundimonas sp. TaxID=1871086 RepID=UPI001A1D3E49|nr:hypothetical protein [Brevundimonas sp.]MBJ7446317.1 hypothetical protein [Brevundimonas sp.]